MDDIEIFLKKRQTERVNIVANNVKTILKMKIKGYEKLFQNRRSMFANTEAAPGGVL